MVFDSTASLGDTSPLPTALVTGATRGIGRAIALDLGRTHHVILAGRDQAALDALAAELTSASTWAVELAGDEPLDGFLSSVPEGGLDVVVHSAGVEDGGAVADTSRAVWRSVYEVNVVAVAEVTRLALPALRKAEGTVILINSGSGFAAGPGGGVYAASKFALRALADALREEERANGVRVSSVHPGRTDSDMQRGLVAKQGGEYDTDLYLAAHDIADAVRLVVDLPHTAVAEVVSVRPLRKV
ncbi:short chain dehydrogenase [Frondihabitans sucicola]|uniref:Short chain dehydrogenase n=1 Tax=Frondihabitans sucicola TaxID=1268041 RepID=A0ABN6Y7B7_9MICO|nr:SDR family oxidoreductase [Frondihabitans sucicola]BDZ51840.1 short chain dehydrogenase [Frondihabitans sucicola]